MKIKDILTTDDKWCKRAYYKDAKGCIADRKDYKQCCLVGAMKVAYPSVYDREVIHNKLDEAVHNLTGKSFDTLESFNDYPSTTFTMIKQVIEKADV